MPQSPNAASLGKYGDVDVTSYTGQINPSINLMTIAFNDFSYPLVLSYAAAGLKVQETPSWCGMGWSINATGVINRMVRGVPDEMTRGYNGQNPTATVVQSIIANNYTPTPAYAGISLNDFRKNIAENLYDGEPDLFNFSFAGHSGKFFFDETQVNQTQKTPFLYRVSLWG